MGAIKQYLNFNYNGKSSTEFGAIQASVDSGLFEDLFVASKSIREEKPTGRTKPYLFGVEREPIEIPITIYCQNGFTDESLRSIKRWIDIDQYAEFFFEEAPERRYFLMSTGDSRISHNGNGEGFFQITFRANDAYAYSPEYLDDVIDLSANPIEGTIVTLENKGDVILRPELEITKIGAGDVSIENLSNGGEIFQFTALEDQEVVYVSNEDEDIISDIPGTYRIDNFNDNYLQLIYGVNRLLVKGQAKLQFRYRYKFK